MLHARIVPWLIILSRMQIIFHTALSYPCLVVVFRMTVVDKNVNI